MEKIFYNAEDIMEICQVKRTKAYEIIRTLNKELDAQGFIVPKKGQVQKNYANKRLNIE